MKQVFIAHEGETGRLCTGMLQELIDRCAAAGGGQVRLTAGNYLSGTLYLKDGVELYLDAGAVLRGSADRADYSHRCPQPSMVEGVPQWYNALIAAVSVKDTAVLGEGTIDGADCLDPDGEQGFRGPHAVFFYDCENVRVEGVTLVRAACYSLMFDRCRHIRVRQVSIFGGQDGFRFGACEDAEITGCDVRSGDDCIGGSGNRDIRIFDTALNTPGGAILQLSSKGLHVRNCVFWAPGVYPAVFREDKRYSLSYAAVCAGMDYEYPRGEESDDWLFEHVLFENAELLFRWEKDMYGRKNIPLHHVTFDHVRAENLVFPCLIDAAAGTPVSLTFRNSEFECAAEDERCDGLFLKGHDFSRLEMENVVLRGYREQPFEISGAGSVCLRNVRVEKRLTDSCISPDCAGEVLVEPGKPETYLNREITAGVTSLVLPAEHGEEFRGALPCVPKPEAGAQPVMNRGRCTE